MRHSGTYEDASDEEIGEISKLFPGLTCKGCGGASVAVKKWWTIEGKPMGSGPNKVSVTNHIFLWQCDGCGKRFRVTKSETRRLPQG